MWRDLGGSGGIWAVSGACPASISADPSPRAISAQLRGMGTPWGSQHISWCVSAISHLPASHLGQTCRTPQDSNPEQGNGCHHSAQVSLARWLWGTCTSSSATDMAAAVQELWHSAPLSAWGSIQSTASIHPICKQKMVWHWCPKKCSWMPFKQINT